MTDEKLKIHKTMKEGRKAHLKEAKRFFGDHAYIPTNRYDMSGAEIIGYLDTPDGVYSVVSLEEDQ